MSHNLHFSLAMFWLRGLVKFYYFIFMNNILVDTLEKCTHHPTYTLEFEEFCKSDLLLSFSNQWNLLEIIFEDYLKHKQRRLAAFKIKHVTSFHKFHFKSGMVCWILQLGCSVVKSINFIEKRPIFLFHVIRGITSRKWSLVIVHKCLFPVGFFTFFIVVSIEPRICWGWIKRFLEKN